MRGDEQRPAPRPGPGMLPLPDTDVSPSGGAYDADRLFGAPPPAAVVDAPAGHSEVSQPASETAPRAIMRPDSLPGQVTGYGPTPYGEPGPGGWQGYGPYPPIYQRYPELPPGYGTGPMPPPVGHQPRYGADHPPWGFMPESDPGGMPQTEPEAARPPTPSGFAAGSDAPAGQAAGGFAPQMPSETADRGYRPAPEAPQFPFGPGYEHPGAPIAPAEDALFRPQSRPPFD